MDCQAAGGSGRPIQRRQQRRPVRRLDHHAGERVALKGYAAQVAEQLTGGRPDRADPARRQKQMLTLRGYLESYRRVQREIGRPANKVPKRFVERANQVNRLKIKTGARYVGQLTRYVGQS